MKIYIEGTITIIDNEQEKDIEFCISNHDSWSQWGAGESILWETMPIVEKLHQSLNDEFFYNNEEE